MQTTDLGGGRGWLDAPAAASIARIDAQLGRRLQITEAGRTRDRQAELRRDYERGLPGAAFALPPDPPEGPSIHQLGGAIDTDEWASASVLALLGEHGWARTALNRKEPWHFEYAPTRDQHITDHQTPNEEETDMTPTAPAVIFRRESTGTSYLMIPGYSISEHVNFTGWQLDTYMLTGTWPSDNAANDAAERQRLGERSISDEYLSWTLVRWGFQSIAADLSKLPTLGGTVYADRLS